jgi:hypothetical protein
MGGSSEAAFAPGLEGLVAAETRISGVDDGAGVLTLAGFPVEEISGRASFEEGGLRPLARRVAGRREVRGFPGGAGGCRGSGYSPLTSTDSASTKAPSATRS